LKQVFNSLIVVFPLIQKTDRVLNKNSGGLAQSNLPLYYHFMRTELVTTLKRQATELLADIERDRKPILITQHGLPSAYLVDVETFELLQQRMAVLEGIARGEMAVAEGRVVSHAKARTRMARWLK
jgi:prevent-host-death family protein